MNILKVFTSFNEETDGRTDGQADGRTDRRTDGRTEKIKKYLLCFAENELRGHISDFDTSLKCPPVQI